MKSLDSSSSDGALDLACNSLPGVSVSHEEHVEVLCTRKLLESVCFFFMSCNVTMLPSEIRVELCNK